MVQAIRLWFWLAVSDFNLYDVAAIRKSFDCDFVMRAPKPKDVLLPSDLFGLTLMIFLEC